MFAATDQILQQQQFSPTPMMAIDGRWRGHVPQAPNCPRCASTNTKFCYYNNYSLAQPRYFCKGCRRYWTKGGSLRNVPVGGGCRKSRRSRSKAHRNSADDRAHQRHANGGDSATDSCSSSGKSTGAEIDLAAVFARYLGQGAPSQSASEGEGEGLQSFISENENSQTAPLDDALFYQDVQMQNQHTEVTEQSQYLPQGMAMDDQGWQEGNNDLGFTGNDDLKSFDQEMLLTDDVFWSASEDGSSLSSNFPAWEPMAALEELDSSQIPYTASVLDDQLGTASTNILVSDANWGSFDLGGYGDLYRP